MKWFNNIFIAIQKLVFSGYPEKIVVELEEVEGGWNYLDEIEVVEDSGLGTNCCKQTLNLRLSLEEKRTVSLWILLLVR